MATIKHVATSPLWSEGATASVNTQCVDSEGNFVPSIQFTIGQSFETTDSIVEGSGLTFESQVMKIGTGEVVAIKDLLTQGGDWELI